MLTATEIIDRRAQPAAALGAAATSLTAARQDLADRFGKGGTLRVELANTDASVLPAGLRLSDNDTRILAVAMHLTQDGQEVTVVSKDLPMRVKAASLGINVGRVGDDPV